MTIFYGYKPWSSTSEGWMAESTLDPSSGFKWLGYTLDYQIIYPKAIATLGTLQYMCGNN